MNFAHFDFRIFINHVRSFLENITNIFIVNDIAQTNNPEIKKSIHVVTEYIVLNKSEIMTTMDIPIIPRNIVG